MKSRKIIAEAKANLKPLLPFLQSLVDSKDTQGVSYDLLLSEDGEAGDYNQYETNPDYKRLEDISNQLRYLKTFRYRHRDRTVKKFIFAWGSKTPSRVETRHYFGKFKALKPVIMKEHHKDCSNKITYVCDKCHYWSIENEHHKGDCYEIKPCGYNGCKKFVADRGTLSHCQDCFLDMNDKQRPGWKINKTDEEILDEQVAFLSDVHNPEDSMIED